MRTVKFKHQHAKHRLRIQGKHVQFKDGLAEVDEETASAIEKLDDPDYTVLSKPKSSSKPKSKPQSKPKPKPKPKSKSKSKTKK